MTTIFLKHVAYATLFAMATLGIGIANYNGLIGSTVHIINHSIIKAAIFLAIGCLVFSSKIVNIDQLAGLGKRMPMVAVCITVSSLSLIGVPGTVGFISKWYLVLGSLEQGLWVVVFALAVSSILALIYVCLLYTSPSPRDS